MKKIISIHIVMFLIFNSVVQAPPVEGDQIEGHVKESAVESNESITRNAIEAESYAKSDAPQPFESHNREAAISIRHVLRVDNPESGGLALGDVPKSTGSIQTTGGFKVHVAVNKEGKATKTIITHPTAWLGLSKPETTIVHKSDGTHVVTVTDQGILGIFSKPAKQIIVADENGSVHVGTADRKTNTIKAVEYDTQGQQQSVTIRDRTSDIFGAKKATKTTSDGTVLEEITMKDGSSKTNILYKNKTSINVVKQADGTQSVTTKDYQPTESDADDLQKGIMTPGSILAAKQAIGITDLSSDNLTDKDIKTAYRKSSLKYHPDKSAGKSADVIAENSNKFTAAKNAQDLLLQRTNTASSTAA